MENRYESLIGNGIDFENGARLNREPSKTVSGVAQNENWLSSSEHTDVLQYLQMRCYKEESCRNKAYYK